MISEVRNTINYHDLNIAKQKDLSLFKIPHCEASFLQHVKRAAWQAGNGKDPMLGFLIWVHLLILAGYKSKDVIYSIL